MAKQLAKEIYALAENDHSWNPSDLKQSLVQNQDKDFKRWRETLKSVIKIQIDSSNAMTTHKYDLRANNFPVNNISSSGYKRSKYAIKGKYTRKIRSYRKMWLTVTDEKMKRFLDEVVYQLDLDWCIREGEHSNMYIIVTWDHWLKK